MRDDPTGSARLSELVAAARAGEVGAAQALVEAVWADAFRIAHTVLRDAPLSEDVAQEACVRLLAKLGTLRRAEAFRPWFYRLVTREAWARLPRHGRETPWEEVEALAAIGTGTVELLDLRQAIGALPATYRLPLLFHYYLGLSDRETAEALGTTAGAVRVRLAVARRRLKLALQDGSPPPRASTHMRPWPRPSGGER